MVRESSLLEHIYSFNRSIGEQVVIPPGDDMAMVLLAGRQVLASVDQLVEGRHFGTGTSIELIGRKAITRNLSDIAAMAARPTAALAAGVLPQEWSEADANRLFDAMRQTAEHYGCPLIGGDIAVHRAERMPLVCTVTVLAEPWGEDLVPRRRGDGSAGDVVYVSGALGGSFGANGLGRHLTFEPRVREAEALIRFLGGHLHGVIDLSDGLGRDAGRMAKASGLVFELDATLIPCHAGCSVRQALGDGEDYELCFTASGDVPMEVCGTSVTPIGQAREANPGESPGAVFCNLDGKRVDVSQMGWDHQGT